MSNANWWAKQLGAQPQAPQQRPVNNPMPPSQQPMTPYVAPQQQTPSAAKAQSATQSNPCPECGGGNYMSPQPNIALRCYDCGYPVMQSGSRYGALTGAKVEGGVKSAIGNSSTSGFNPMPDGYNSQGQKI
jgi:hypothetical protein